MKIRNGISPEQAKRSAAYQRLTQGWNVHTMPKQSKAELKAMLQQAAKNTVTRRRSA